MVGSKHLRYLDCYRVCLVKAHADLTASHVGCACAQLVGFGVRLIQVLYCCFAVQQVAEGPCASVFFVGNGMRLLSAQQCLGAVTKGSVWRRSGVHTAAGGDQ